MIVMHNEKKFQVRFLYEKPRQIIDEEITIISPTEKLVKLVPRSFISKADNKSHPAYENNPRTTTCTISELLPNNEETILATAVVNVNSAEGDVFSKAGGRRFSFAKTARKLEDQNLRIVIVNEFEKNFGPIDIFDP